MMTSQGEAKSPLQSIQQQPKNQTNQSLGRQSSIYSLTLDEFQHSLCESGKNFGSMNMDEFLNSIWTAEENQAQDTANSSQAMPLQANTTGKGISKQGSLSRQGSLTLPDPLCKKTVEEVWSETTTLRATSRIPRGSPPLEDFLVRAGADCATSAEQQLSRGGAKFCWWTHDGGSSRRLSRGSGRDENGWVVCARCRLWWKNREWKWRIWTGAGFGNRAPISPTGAEGDESSRYGGVKGARRRVMDAQVVERRQRRMIKNSKSAARSRARKQAYTVELEAELNQLKEENEHLKQALAELERKRRKQYHEEKRAKAHIQSKAERAREKLQSMRRSSSC